MAHDVFVSYSHKDKPVADAVVAGLEGQGIRCWFAPRDIIPGSSWGESIISAIEGSRIMVIILSGNSNSSNQVVREVERAVANNVIIIPFRIENIDPTGAMAYFLSTEHWLDAISSPLEKHIQKLIHAILVFQDEEKLSDLPAEVIRRPKPKKKLSVKTLLAIFGSVVVIGLAISILLGLLSRSSSQQEETSLPTADLTWVPPEMLQQTETAMAVVQATENPAVTVSPTLQPSLRLVGKFQTSRAVMDVFVQNNTAYLANSEDGLLILDVSDPSNPTQIGNYEIGDAVEVTLVDDVAYVLDKAYPYNNRVNDVVHMINVEQPSYPEKIASIWAQYNTGTGYIYNDINNFTVSEQVVYLIDGDGLLLTDVSTPTLPPLIGEFAFFSNVSNPGISVKERIAYIQANSLLVVDFRDPANPVEIGGFDAGWGSQIQIIDQIAYVIGWDSGLNILDISDPTRPIKLGQFNELIGNYDLVPKGFSTRQTFIYSTVSGDIAYMSFSFGLDQGTWIQTLENGIVILDISDPTQPVMLDKFTDFDEVSSIFATDDLVFVTDETRGLFIFSCQR